MKDILSIVESRLRTFLNACNKILQYDWLRKDIKPGTI